MFSEPLIEVCGVHMRYRDRVGLAALLGRETRNAVHAVRGVSFDVAEGEIFGVVGRNGAGKSTLLRGIAGILPISDGRIVVRDRLTTLLSLGVGFNTHLSGRQNVMLGGLAAGLTPEDVRSRMDDIIAFSELGEVIDRPVRTYSSGMRGRLGFSVSTFVDPGILLVDEALATGDLGFSEKAFARVRKLVADGHAAVIVSHSISQVRALAHRCMWIDRGQAREVGDPPEVLRSYSRWVKGQVS